MLVLWPRFHDWFRLPATDFLERMGRRSESTRLTYACGLDAFARCFDVQSVGLLIAKIKSGELDAYETLDKFVGWLTGKGAAPKPHLDLRGRC